MNVVPLLVGGGRLLGIILIFLGTLIAVIGASVPGSCFPSGCSGFITQAANAILVGKILWVLGLFGIAGASGLRLQNGFMPGSSISSDEGDGKVARIRGNLLIVIISVLLMALILLTINLLPYFALP